MLFSDSVDLKDLQYQVVKSRKQAVTLITDIYNAEAKTTIKNIKEIENQPISAEFNYKPLNYEKIRSVPIPAINQVKG